MVAGCGADIRRTPEAPGKLHMPPSVSTIITDRSVHVADTDITDLPAVVGGTEPIISTRGSAAISSSCWIEREWALDRHRRYRDNVSGWNRISQPFSSDAWAIAAIFAGRCRRHGYPDWTTRGRLWSL